MVSYEMIKSALREQFAILRNDNTQILTEMAVKSATAKALGLKPGFFKRKNRGQLAREVIAEILDDEKQRKEKPQRSEDNKRGPESVAQHQPQQPQSPKAKQPAESHEPAQSETTKKRADTNAVASSGSRKRKSEELLEGPAEKKSKKTGDEAAEPNPRRRLTRGGLKTAKDERDGVEPRAAPNSASTSSKGPAKQAKPDAETVRKPSIAPKTTSIISSKAERAGKKAQRKSSPAKVVKSSSKSKSKPAKELQVKLQQADASRHPVRGKARRADSATKPSVRTELDELERDNRRWAADEETKEEKVEEEGAARKEWQDLIAVFDGDGEEEEGDE